MDLLRCVGRVAGRQLLLLCCAFSNTKRAASGRGRSQKVTDGRRPTTLAAVNRVLPFKMNDTRAKMQRGRAEKGMQQGARRSLLWPLAAPLWPFQLLAVDNRRCEAMVLDGLSRRP